ncbi:MAG: TatD family hydrolase [Thermoplasmata archaeon]|nr:TatD family hydrolase [Thermoplasmata archaeon]MCI4359181.1 TatD family hydrolase [Thermoplasmata archaeon]
MALPHDLPVVDHHCHLSPTGDGIEAARRFEKAGGTHLFLATQQYGEHPPSSVGEYEGQFEATDAIARGVEQATGVRVYRVVAPYPVDLITLAPRLGLAEARRVIEGALELAGRWVREGRAVALGEVGRPHFAMEQALRDASEELFRRALEVATDVGCPAVVHCEDLDAAGYQAMADLASRVGFPVHRLVKHYARSWIPPEERAGIVPSFLASRDLSARVLLDNGPWLWETDYLDDPKRPGAVLDLATIPRRAAQVAASGSAALEALRIPFETAIRSVYGFTPAVDDRRRPSGRP